MKNLRIYIATQKDCIPCEKTKEVLGIKNSKGELLGVPIHEVNLTSNPERSEKMGVTKTPTIFIVEGEDTDKDGTWEEAEEKHVWHQTGIISDKTNLEGYIKILKEGGDISTPLV